MGKISRSEYLDRRVELHKSIVDCRTRMLERVGSLVASGSLTPEDLDIASMNLWLASLDLIQAAYERDSETYPGVNK